MTKELPARNHVTFHGQDGQWRPESHSKRLVVLGDFAFDETAHIRQGNDARRSPLSEEIWEMRGIPTVTLGGSGAMARAACCVCHVDIIAVGSDAARVRAEVQRFNATAFPHAPERLHLHHVQSDRDWAVKRRYLIRGGQTRVRIDYEERAELDLSTSEALVARAKQLLVPDAAGACLIADFQKGTITPTVFEHLRDHCRRTGIPLVLAMNKPAGSERMRKYLGSHVSFVLRQDVVEHVAGQHAIGAERVELPECGALFFPGSVFLLLEPDDTHALRVSVSYGAIDALQHASAELVHATEYKTTAYSVFAGVVAGARAARFDERGALELAANGLQAFYRKPPFADLTFTDISAEGNSTIAVSDGEGAAIAPWVLMPIARGQLRIDFEGARTALDGLVSICEEKRRLIQDLRTWTDRWVAADGEAPAPLLLMGGSGDGKTFLAKAAQSELSRHGYEVRYENCGELTAGQLVQLPKRLESARPVVLILDEADKPPASPKGPRARGRDWQSSWLPFLKPEGAKKRAKRPTIAIIATVSTLGQTLQTRADFEREHEDQLYDFYARFAAQTVPSFSRQRTDLGLVIARRLVASGVSEIQVGAMAQLINQPYETWHGVDKVLQRVPIAGDGRLRIEQFASILPDRGRRPFETNDAWIVLK